MNERPDNPDLEAEFTPAENIEQDHRGSVMLEYESYERVVEGLKLAADGMRNMARFSDADLWNAIAEFVDSVRKAIVRLAGLGPGADTRETVTQWGGSGISRTEALSRITRGLKDSAAGANQVALVQRKDGRWLRYANQIERMRERAQQLALSGSPLVVDSRFQRTTH